jgi:hypothetical protein
MTGERYTLDARAKPLEIYPFLLTHVRLQAYVPGVNDGGLKPYDNIRIHHPTSGAI